MKVTFNPTNKTVTPTADNGLKVEYSEAKRGGFKLRWYLLILLVIAPVMLMLWVLISPYLFIIAPGIITTEPLKVSAPFSGQVTQIYAQQGATLNAKQAIIAIESSAINAQILELKKQQASLAQPLSTIQQQLLEQFNERVEIAKQGVVRIEKLQQEFDKFQKQGLIPLSDAVMISLVQYRTEAEMNLEQSLTEQMNQEYQLKIENLAGDVTKLSHDIALQLAKLEAQQQSLVITSPFAAKVVDVHVQVGEQINPSTTLLWLSDREQPIISAYLEPKYLDYTKLKQMATIQLPNNVEIRAEISEPTELVGQLPQYLASPFAGEKPVLKVTLKPLEPLPTEIEGVPVKVHFDRHWPWS